MNSGTVDLIYLDPPFNSNQDYAHPSARRQRGPRSRTPGRSMTWTGSGFSYSGIQTPCCIT